MTFFPLINKQIKAKNENFLIFYLKFLDVSIKALEENCDKDKIEMTINLDDLETCGKDKDLIKQYIKLSSLYDAQSTKIYFYFLNGEFTLLKTVFEYLDKMSDLLDLNALEKLYKKEKLYKENRPDELIQIEEEENITKTLKFKIKINLREDINEEKEKLTEIKNTKEEAKRDKK